MVFPQQNVQTDEKHRGTVFFVLGVLIALFFGGAVRTLLSPQQVENYINKEIEKRQPKFEVEYSLAQLSLSRGWVPRLGLQLNGLKLVSTNRCLNPVDLQIDEVYVPVNIRQFLRGRLQFLNIEFGNLQITGLRREHDCRSEVLSQDGTTSELNNQQAPEVDKRSTQVSGPWNSKQPFDEFMERFNSFVNSRWATELKNTRKWFTGLSAQSISFELEDHSERIHRLQNLQITMGEAGELAKMSFRYTPDPDLVYYQPLQNIETKVEVDEKLLRIQGRSGFKEGIWSFSGEVLLGSNQFQLRSDFKNVPVAEVFQGFSKKGILPKVEGSRPIWLSCHQDLDGSLLNWRQSQLQISKCLIFGDLGAIKLSETQVKPFLTPIQHQPFKIHLTQFSLENLLDAFNKKPPFEIFHQLGDVTGEILVSNLNQIGFRGSIDNLSLQVLNNSKRGFQQIKTIEGELLFNDSRFSGKVTKAEIVEGEFEGQISLNLDRRFREGVLQANVSKINISPEILNILQLEGVEHFEIYGQGNVKNGDIVSWDGSIGIPKLEEDGLVLEKTKFKSSWKDSQWKGRLSANKATFKSPHPLFQLLSPLYLEENKFADELRLKNISSNLLINSEKFAWKKAKAWDADKDIVFATDGQFDNAGVLIGEIIVDFPVLKLLKWEIEGTFEDPQIRPSSKMLKELAKKRPDAPAPSAIEFATEKFYLPKAFQKGASASFNTIKNKVLDSARKILPPNEKPKRARSNDVDQ